MENSISQERYFNLKKEKSKLSQENLQLKSELKKLNSDCGEQLEYLNEYAELERIFNAYCSLDYDIQKSLSNVISNNSVIEFVISAGQWKSIEALWENIAYRLDSTPAEELKSLIGIFEWLFIKYNEFYDEYSLLKTEKGEIFDTDFHSKGNRSAVSGAIKEILLRGYKNNTNGKIVKKSIVRI